MRRYTADFVKHHRPQAVPQVQSTLAKLELCRTGALGGHLYRCDPCDFECRVNNSCGDRHCPQCAGAKRADWLESTSELLLPGVTYFQVVFTIPDKLSSLALGNREAIYDLLFRSAWKTLRDVIADEQQFEAAAVMVLHTWNQKLEAHAHVHALVPGGGPSLTGDRRWIKSRRVGKGVRTQLPERPAGCCAQLSPDPVSNYLVTFLARVGKKTGGDDAVEPIRLRGAEFVRRWCLHILPKGYTKTRRFGGYWNGHRARYLAECRALLESVGVAAVPSEARASILSAAVSDADAIDDTTPCCPKCTAKMRWIGSARKESWRIIMHSGLRPHWYRDD